jgi:hypothetical protein
VLEGVRKSVAITDPEDIEVVSSLKPTQAA